mmetsp:Transcript_2252/g.5084  ORF Transcript_2252/g.5084 Transcript_2252/m.5084 type:complete len:296 (-) Transcript_2252:11-898(-)
MFSRTTAAASIVLLLCVRAGRADHLHGEEIGALNAFFAAINASSEAATKVVALDIGSNDGKWSSHVLNHLTQQGRRCRLVMFEAQTTLLHQLHSIAKHHAPQHSVEVVGSAVWTSDTKLTFHLSKNSEAASITPTLAQTAGAHTKTVSVRAVDLAPIWERELRSATTSFVKVDVEAAEYVLLPYLLARGLLCLPSFLSVEWHLNALAPERRLEALSMRHTLDAILQQCPRPPKLIHQEFPQNNFWVPVPGLQEMALRHSESSRPPRCGRGRDAAPDCLAWDQRVPWSSIHRNKTR